MELNPRTPDVPVTRPICETMTEKDSQLDRAVKELLGNKIGVGGVEFDRAVGTFEKVFERKPEFLEQAAGSIVANAGDGENILESEFIPPVFEHCGGRFAPKSTSFKLR